MSTNHAEYEAFSPETGQQALVLARRELSNQVAVFDQQMREKQQALQTQQRAIEAARLRVQQQEADNWRETNNIRTQQAMIESQTAMIKRDQDLLEARERQLQTMEDQRRRNRTISEAYIEDLFAVLSPRAVVENLTNSSPRMRKHAMDNISACIAGNENTSPMFARFTPQEIASDILPKLHQLYCSSSKPITSVTEFVEGVISATPMVKALAHAGECPRLADYLIQTNEMASRMAITCLRRMVGMETSVVKPAYEALALAIPLIPETKKDKNPHPAIDFVRSVAPKIIEDCFNNGLWLSVAPLVSHRVVSIRQTVLQKVVIMARLSDQNRHGIVEANVLGLLDSYYQTSFPPPDIVDFFVELLPLVSGQLARRPVAVEWLLKRLGDPTAKINAAIIDAFRTCMVEGDPTVFKLFVSVQLLKRLDDPAIQHSHAVTKLIRQGLSALAIPYARSKAVEGVVRFLDHSDPILADAALSACLKILGSTLDDRNHLLSVISKLNLAKETTLKLYESALPIFCKDWVAAGEFSMIVPFIQHSEGRIRLPAQQIWGDIVCNSSTARSKIVHDGLLDITFDLCNSQYEDAIVLGARCCSPMATEIIKAGLSSTQQLIDLLNHPNKHLRLASILGVRIASESTDESCEVLLKAGAFAALCSLFERYPDDVSDNAYKILTRLAPFLRTSREACTSLLQLLNSTLQLVQLAARDSLTTISYGSTASRETLRAAVLDCLELPTEALVEFSVKAIQDWIGTDLAQLNDFTRFFSLVEHSDRRIQNAALRSLKERLPNAGYQDSLQKANIMSLLRSLSNSDNPEALIFVTVALPALASSLAQNGHISSIMSLLLHKEPKVRDGATSALEAIASGPARHRKLLLDEELIEKLVGHGEPLEQTQSNLLLSIIPLVAPDYLDAGKMNIIFKLVDHPQQQIRTTVSKAILAIAGGSTTQRTNLRDALLPQLDQASPLLREVGASCLSRSLTNDLISDGRFDQIFHIFWSEDIRLRDPIVSHLQTYIQDSDESTRAKLVHAQILPEITQAYSPGKDDLLEFMTSCVLPLLGPSFTQDDGGKSLFPLLTHNDNRICVSAVRALNNAIDSRYGNVKNMAEAFIVGTLHPLIRSDDGIRDLWCRLLPLAAPYLTTQVEIDLVFSSLSDDRGNVRKAASDAISVMAKTSEISRKCMLPTLLRSLERLSPATVPSIAFAISLSGPAFVSHGKESELLHHILNETYIEISTAAIEATSQLLAKCGSFEHQKLVQASPDILTIALELHGRQSQRAHSLKLLQGLVVHLSYEILNDETLARDMFSLFDDPDPSLSNALFQTWSSDPRVLENDILPELLPILFEDKKLRNPSVSALLRELAPTMVPKLRLRRRLDILVKALKLSNVNVVRAYLQETRSVIELSNDNEKGWFVAEPSFVSAIGTHLMGHDVTMRRDSSTIIYLLSTGSTSRSGRIMNEGIGRYLSWVAVNGEKGAQQSSLQALCTLFMAAPDHADRLVADSLPALCDILEQEGLFLKVYTWALDLLAAIIQQSPHSPIIESGILTHLVKWLSPRHSVTDFECKTSVFRICCFIAQDSDLGRQALIEAGILPELVVLASSQKGLEVISSCKILKALAHTGVFGHEIVAAGLKKSMEHITSLFRKSTLQSPEDRAQAQAAAKEVLAVLKTTRSPDGKMLHSQAANPSLSRSRSVAGIGSSRRNPVADEEEIFRDAEQRRRQNTGRRAASESFQNAGFDIPTHENSTEESRQSSFRNLRHTRSLSENRRPVSIPQNIRLSTVEERSDVPYIQGRNATFNPQENVSDAEPTASSSRLRSSLYLGQSSGSTSPPLIDTTSVPLVVPQRYTDEDQHTDVSSAALTDIRAVPPSYRTLPSVMGTVRRQVGRQAPDIPFATQEESEWDAEEVASKNVQLGLPRSYRQRASNSGRALQQ